MNRSSCQTPLYLLTVFLMTVGSAVAAKPIDAPPADSQRVDFDTQIIPILTSHGCNAGSCHGAAVGRGGFKLSLLGADAAADHDMIVRQLEGRRINLDDPDVSLLLRKPSEQTGHEGGHVLAEDSLAFDILRTWIDQGANRLQRRSLVRFELSPVQSRLTSTDQKISFSATAFFSDRSRHDVTDWTVFKADDPEAVEIDLASRTMTVQRSGVHVVIARYLDRVMPIRLVVPIHERLSSATVVPAANNKIDEFINAQLDELNLAASPPAENREFLRRVTLDLTGRLPTPEQLHQFIADDSSSKRSRTIERLLSSESFSQYWGLKWANVLGIDSKQLQAEGADAYHRWMVQRLQDDAPMNETARLMLTAVGDSYVQGAANFSRFGSSPGDLAEHATRVLMGVRLSCANCHDHPLDSWKQDDYHGLAAIFSKVKRGRVVTLSDRGEVTHPVTGQAAVQKIPGAQYLAGDVDGRNEFAKWLTSSDSPYLARVTVNRLWQQLMGRGLVEPVDDIRVTNPATHPELLDWLANDFARHDFRLKHTIALICNSAAYQRTSASVAKNQSDTVFYSHALRRPLEAEVIADAIGDVTGIPLDLGQMQRAVALTDNRLNSPSLDVLGRCDRAEACDSSSSSSASLTRSLHLINGSLINDRLKSPHGRLATLLDSRRSDEQIVDELYLLTLARLPSEGFLTKQSEAVDLTDPSERREFFEDLLWGLITSDAFTTNH